MAHWLARCRAGMVPGLYEQCEATGIGDTLGKEEKQKT
jgi:hypothetical protein